MPAGLFMGSKVALEFIFKLDLLFATRESLLFTRSVVIITEAEFGSICLVKPFEMSNDDIIFEPYKSFEMLPAQMEIMAFFELGEACIRLMFIERMTRFFGSRLFLW